MRRRPSPCSPKPRASAAARLRCPPPARERMRVRESAPFVDLPPVPWCDHEHDQDTVVDLIDNPVVTGPHSPLAVATDEVLGAAGPRLCGTRHSASASGWAPAGFSQECDLGGPLGRRHGCAVLSPSLPDPRPQTRSSRHNDPDPPPEIEPLANRWLLLQGVNTILGRVRMCFLGRTRLCVGCPPSGSRNLMSGRPCSRASTARTLG